jgi:hypothetical protein
LAVASALHYIGSKRHKASPPRKSKESVMNLKTILVSLVLGSSSIALAAPAAPTPAPTATVVVRDHAAGTEYTVADAQAARPNAIDYKDGQSWRGMPKPPVYRPVTLASGMRLTSGRASIAVGSQAGKFDTLQLTASAGKTFIKQVTVQFNNGQNQVVGLGKTLDGNDSLTIDLAGNHRKIRKIVVTGNELSTGRRRPFGAFNIIAS